MLSLLSVELLPASESTLSGSDVPARGVSNDDDEALEYPSSSPESMLNDCDVPTRGDRRDDDGALEYPSSSSESTLNGVDVPARGVISDVDEVAGSRGEGEAERG